MIVRRKRGESSVLDRFSNGKMINVLECVIAKPENLVSNVVEEAAHPRASQPLSLGIEIKDLPYHARFPMETPIMKGMFFYVFPEKCYHRQREDAVSRNILVSTGRCPFVSKIALFKKIKAYGFWRLYFLPKKIMVAYPPYLFEVSFIP